MICQVLGISRSQLYRLLESEGGVARYIQRHRLQASYEAITEPEEQRSIAEIALACGFYDSSTFSRAFRKEFGISPSDAREATRAGERLIIARKPAMRAEGRTPYATLRAY